MTEEDKEKIKIAVLESISRQNGDAKHLAAQACFAVDFINNYDDKKTSGDLPAPIGV